MEALKIEIVKTVAERAAEVAAIDATTFAETTKTTTSITSAITAIQAVKDTSKNKKLNDRITTIKAKLTVTSLSTIEVANVAYGTTKNKVVLPKKLY